MRDDKTCGSVHADGEQAEIIKAERDGVVDVANTSTGGVPGQVTPRTSFETIKNLQEEVPPPLTDVGPSSSTRPPSKRADSAVSLPPKTSAMTRPGPSSSSRSAVSPISAKRLSPRPKSSVAVSSSTDPVAPWPCPTCTFLNSRLLPRCEICDSPPAREQIERDGWVCSRCATTGIDAQWWTCVTCGELKGAS